jgi:hypothetical protein
VELDGPIAGTLELPGDVGGVEGLAERLTARVAREERPRHDEVMASRPLLDDGRLGDLEEPRQVAPLG